MATSDSKKDKDKKDLDITLESLHEEVTALRDEVEALKQHGGPGVVCFCGTPSVVRCQQSPVTCDCATPSPVRECDEPVTCDCATPSPVRKCDEPHCLCDTPSPVVLCQRCQPVTCACGTASPVMRCDQGQQSQQGYAPQCQVCCSIPTVTICPACQMAQGQQGPFCCNTPTCLCGTPSPVMFCQQSAQQGYAPQCAVCSIPTTMCPGPVCFCSIPTPVMFCSQPTCLCGTPSPVALCQQTAQCRVHCATPTVYGTCPCSVPSMTCDCSMPQSYCGQPRCASYGAPVPCATPCAVPCATY